jgi:outer membrane protein TolC
LPSTHYFTKSGGDLARTVLIASGKVKTTLLSSGVLAVLAALTAARPVSALQPLSDFLSAAKTNNLDDREARELAEQRIGEAEQQWTKLLPTLTAQATYTRNQYEASVTLPAAAGEAPRTAVITPLDQRDLVFTAQATIFDLGQIHRAQGADATADAQEARVRSTELDTSKSVARTYYQLVGAEALVLSAERSLAASEDNQAFVEKRLDAGFASALDVQRAVAAVEASRQDVAQAELTRVLAVRALSTTTGLSATPGGPALEDDLHDEAPLESWEGTAIGGLPSVVAANLDARAARKNADATRDALVPTVSATGTERFTNAAGFGTSPYYAIGASLTWHFDVSTLYATRAQEAAYQAARTREEQAKLTARDAIHEAWQTIRADQVKSRAAHAQVAASAEAARLARDRYASGTATQLEVVQAQRDAFTAEVSRIQADADLVYARAWLRLAAGRTRFAGEAGR